MEWERRRREAEQDAQKSHRRVVDERRERMRIRQQQREKDYQLKKQENLNQKSSHDLSNAVKVTIAFEFKTQFLFFTFALLEI